MPTVVIAAGGTGGHLFPAEALAEALIARGHRIVLMTDRRSTAIDSAVFASRERIVLPGAGLVGRGALRKVAGTAALAAGTLRARRELARIAPAMVVGFGGYPSVAPVMAAAMLRPRPAIILHEQNAVLGSANRFLARRADLLATSFADTGDVPAGVRSSVTGNPVRPAIQALAGRGYAAPDETINLLVLGGSLGARVLSDVVPPALASLPPDLRARIALVQQARGEDVARVRAAYHGAGITAEIAPFFADIAVLLDAAHLVIARAGASTVAEIAVAGRPAIFIPLPVSIGHDQGRNARALEQAGAAAILPQEMLTAASLSAQIGDMLAAPERLAAAASSGASLGRPDAAAALADLVEARIAQEQAA